MHVYVVLNKEEGSLIWPDGWMDGWERGKEGRWVGGKGRRKEENAISKQMVKRR